MVDMSKWFSAKQTTPLARDPREIDNADAEVAKLREYMRRSQTQQRASSIRAVEENKGIFSRMKG